MTRAPLLLVSLLACALATTADANLLVNGSFEHGDDPQLYEVSPTSSPQIPGWSVGPADVDWVGPQWNAPHGTRSLDLNGTAAGSVRQTFHSSAGTRYVLDFDMSGNSGCGPGNVTLDVELHDGSTPGVPFHVESFNFTISQSQTDLTMRWLPKSFCFDALSETTTVVFRSTKIGRCGPGIDHVVLRDACCAGGVCHSDVSGTVFEDLDRDGVLDPSEPLIGGARVTLDGNASTITDLSGAYEFNGVAPGARIIRAVTTPGSVITTANDDQQVRIVWVKADALADFGWHAAAPESCGGEPVAAGEGCTARVFVPHVRSYYGVAPAPTLPAFLCNLASAPPARAFRWTLSAPADSAPDFQSAAGTTPVAHDACVALNVPIGHFVPRFPVPPGASISFQLTALDTVTGGRAVYSTGRLVRNTRFLLGSPDTVTQAPDGGSAPLTFNVRALQSGIANYRIHSIAAPGTADRVQLNGGLPGGVVTGSLSLANAESTVVVVQISYPPGSAFVPFDQVVLDVDVDGDGDLDEAEAAAVAPRSIAFAGVEEALPGLEMHAKPNPFSQSLEIAFTLARGGAVRVEAFDVAGRRVRTLQREHLAAGPHRVVWDGRDDAGHPVTGVVFVRVTSAEGSRTERAVRFER